MRREPDSRNGADEASHEHVADELVVVGRHGEAMPIDEDEIDVWLSPGSFG